MMRRRRRLIVLLSISSILPVQAQTANPHLTFGNPSGATPDPTQPTNYLITSCPYALAYSRDDSIPRWVAWRLVASDLGPAPRCDCFQPDTTLPTGWPRIVTGDYTNSGYDRGHMVPSEDRTATDADNEATFLMTNVVSQSPQNNRGPWVDLEEASRTLARAGNDVYLVAGPDGEIGRLPSKNIRIPAATWKVVLVVPPGPGDPQARVTTASRAIAIRVPNNKDDTRVRQTDAWTQYRTTVDAIEAATGLDLLSNLDPVIQQAIERRVDTGPLTATLAISGTSALTVTAGTAFPSPIVVRVTDALSQPVAGTEVTFAARGIAASAAFGTSPLTMTLTAADGTAQLTPVANAISGTYQIEASISGVSTPTIVRVTQLTEVTTTQRLFVALVIR